MRVSQQKEGVADTYVIVLDRVGVVLLIVGAESEKYLSFQILVLETVEAKRITKLWLSPALIMSLVLVAPFILLYGCLQLFKQEIGQVGLWSSDLGRIRSLGRLKQFETWLLAVGDRRHLEAFGEHGPLQAFDEAAPL